MRCRNLIKDAPDPESWSTGTATSVRREVRSYGINELSQTLLGDMHYLWLYAELLELAERTKEHESGNQLLALVAAAWSWMPTTLKLESLPPKGLLQTIRSIRDARDAASFISGRETAPFGRSWSGSSKVLHFIKPDVFPIWDSRVAVNFGLEHSYQINKPTAYLDYLNWMHFICLPDFNRHRDVCTAMDEALGYPARSGSERPRISKLRAAELILFSLGKRKMLAKRQKVRGSGPLDPATDPVQIGPDPT